MKKTIAIGLITVLLAISLQSFSQSAEQQKPVFNHIALYVTNLAKSTFFYQYIIGLDTIPEPFHDGKHTWFSLGPKQHMHVIAGLPAPINLPQNHHLCFSVASVERFIPVLQQNHIPYENAAGQPNSITTRVDGVKQVYFKDPDGYWVEINDAKE